MIKKNKASKSDNVEAEFCGDDEDFHDPVQADWDEWEKEQPDFLNDAIIINSNFLQKLILQKEEIDRKRTDENEASPPAQPLQPSETSPKSPAESEEPDMKRKRNFDMHPFDKTSKPSPARKTVIAKPRPSKVSTSMFDKRSSNSLLFPSNDAKRSTPSLSARLMEIESSEFEGFRLANGSKIQMNEYEGITSLAAKKPVSQPAKPSSSKPPSTSKTNDPNDLKNHEALKHFEGHIIEHIQAEILASNNNVTWDAVAGLVQAKKTLREIVVFPFLRPDLFKGLRAPSKGVLLFGPPGTGKTLIARCVANQAKATFYNVSVSTVMSKWVGEGEKVVRALFEMARLTLPSIVFIDEIDALLSARKDGDHESSRRVKTEFLIQMDGIATNSDERLLVLGATNKPEDIDEAARRRFPKRLYIALPDFEARKGMIQMHMKNTANELQETDYTRLASMTEGFSGADIFHFAKEAAYGPLRDVINDIENIPAERIRSIKYDDFLTVFSTVKPTVLKSELDSYLEWDKKFGSHSC